MLHHCRLICESFPDGSLSMLAMVVTIQRVYVVKILESFTFKIVSFLIFFLFSINHSLLENWGQEKNFMILCELPIAPLQSWLHMFSGWRKVMTMFWSFLLLGQCYRFLLIAGENPCLIVVTMRKQLYKVKRCFVAGIIESVASEIGLSGNISLHMNIIFLSPYRWLTKREEKTQQILLLLRENWFFTNIRLNVIFKRFF